ncbi:hypothetical protein P22_2303 [Propionispora sp. 2/2-37]|uniref:Na/Pi cotransporter family protein n=1 Tax=Propionispora sp. 2/2-37 TaxID=1677858 RepID=UPI0006BB8C5A|nr:Na/Pi symporter [Propionispora sp. 2/2-37]CUH96214.1 hypothetical protein P22_2303 [Propionispora sp. 2/2-37]
MHILITLIVGISLLLSGIFLMRFSLQHLFWHRVQQILHKMTITPWRGMVLGTIASALMQSSSALTLITIGLVSANYLSFYQALGIILGANIGTCSTVQLMTLTLPENHTLPALVLTALLMILVKKLRYPCMFAIGMLSLFIGLNHLSNALNRLTEHTLLMQCLAITQQNPGYGILAGILITILFQSSSAATGIVMALAADGFLSLDSAAYIIYGNNIGSCFSSLLLGAASPLAGRRVAAAHLLLNLLGVVVALPFTSTLTLLTRLFSDNFSVQIAYIHTLFNLISSLFVLPFTRQYARLIIFLLPDRK